MKILKIISVLLISVYMLSCVNSGMYNTSIGQNSNVKYQTPEPVKEVTPTKTVTQDGYTHIDMGTKNTSTDEKKFTLVKSEIRDTVINKKITVQKIPINEEQKDSLLFALIKDTKRTQEQKDAELEKFIQSHKKEIVLYDTVITSKVKVDTVFANETMVAKDSIQLEKERIQAQIDDLKRKMDAYNNAETKVEKKEAKDDLKKTAWELRNMGRKDARKYHNWLPALLIPLGLLIAFIYLVFSPTSVYSLYQGYLAVLAYFLGLGSGFYFLFGKPIVNWDKIENEYKNDPEYRKAYKQEAKKKNGLMALFGFIPFAVIGSIFALALLIYLSFI